MKRIILAILMFFCLSGCKSQPNPKVWTAKFEQGLYRYLDSVSKPAIPDGAKRKEYVLYLINEYKKRIPNGIKSVSKDSLQKLNDCINMEYIIINQNNGNNIDIKPFYIPWTQVNEKTFLNGFNTLFKNKKQQLINKFCDCYIEKMKKIYPDSVLVPTPKVINDKVTMECKSIFNEN